MPYVIFFWIVSVAIILIGCFLMAKLSIMLAGAAVIFSRISFSLILALAFSQSNPFPVGDAFGNYFLWFAIFLGAILLLSLLPRVNYALKFLSTAFVTAIVPRIALWIVLVMVDGFLSAFNASFIQADNVILNTILTISAIAFSGWTLKKEIETSIANGGERHMPLPLNILQKILASVAYGFGVLLLCTMLITISVPIQWVVLILSTIVAFLFDIFVLDRKLK